MKSLLTVLAGLAMAFAVPAHTQRVADAAPAPAPAPAPAATMAPAAWAPNLALPPVLRPAVPDAREALAPRRPSVAGHVAIGAGAGTLGGALAFLAIYAIDDGCRSADSMCGLAIPVLVGSGVLTGGVAGLVVGLVRNR